VWSRLAFVALAACGRWSFDPLADGATPPDSGDSVCIEATSGACTPGTFARLQVVPSNAPQGGSTQIMGYMTPTASQTITLGAGHLLVAFAYAGQNVGSMPGTLGGSAPNLELVVSDTLGEQYQAGPLVDEPRYSAAGVQIFFVPNTIAGTTTVTVTASSPQLAQPTDYSTGLILAEYSGAATVDVVDASAVNIPPTGTPTPFASVPPVVAHTECELVVGGMTDGHAGNAQETPAAGWAEPVLDEWCPAAYVDLVAGTELGTSAGIHVDFTNSNEVPGANYTDDGWAAAQLAFRASTSTPTCQPRSLAFTTPAVIGSAGACLGPVTIATTRAGAPANTSSAVPLAVDAGAATLYVDAACAFPSPATEIWAGTSSTTFFLRAPAAGSLVLTASAPMGSALDSATQVATIQ
jgi:hypothetical protein